MGTDMYGWVELYNANTYEWNAVLCLDYWIPRNYEAFITLFGIGRREGLTPVAQERGIPVDASALARASFEQEHDGNWMPTWITWSELEPVAMSRDWGNTTWLTLFAFMRDMAAKVVQKPEYVRMVVSFG